MHAHIIQHVPMASCLAARGSQQRSASSHLSQAKGRHHVRPFAATADRNADSADMPADSAIVGKSLATSAASRRAVLAATAAVFPVLPVLQLPALATAEAATDLTLYTDDGEGFSIAVPKGWSFGVGALDGNSSFSGASGSRKAVSWYKEEDPSTNITVVLTTIGADYTSMGSFGSAYDFGSAMVGSMDRGYLLRAPAWARKGEEIQIAKLLESKEINSRPQTYFIEYTVIRPNGDDRHLYSVATLRFNGRYNRLYTVTAQCSEADVGVVGGLLASAVKTLDTQMIA